MKFRLPSACILVASLLVLAVGCKSLRMRRGTTPTHPVEALAGQEYFLRVVKPILETHCLSCHNGDHPAGQLSMSQRSGVYVPRRRYRAYIVPGDPAASRFLTAVSPGGSHPRTLPSAHASLGDFELAALHEWIEDGAFWPDTPDGFLQPRQSPLLP